VFRSEYPDQQKAERESSLKRPPEREPAGYARVRLLRRIGSPPIRQEKRKCQRTEKTAARRRETSPRKRRAAANRIGMRSREWSSRQRTLKVTTCPLTHPAGSTRTSTMVRVRTTRI